MSRTAPLTKDDKQRNERLIASLPVKMQADLLAQALLREYMHRRGFLQTLKAFDTETPRDERTISSRQVMRQLLNIPVPGRQSRLEEAAKKAASAGNEKARMPPTYMEELCSYRLSKRECAQAASKRQHLLRKQEKLEMEGALSMGEAESLRQKLVQLESESQMEDSSDSEMQVLRMQATTRSKEVRDAESQLASFQQLYEAYQREKQSGDGTDKKHKRKDKHKKTNKHRVGGTGSDTEQERDDALNEQGSELGSGDGGLKVSKRKQPPGFLFSQQDKRSAGTTAGPVVGSKWAPPGLGDGAAPAAPSPFTAITDPFAVSPEKTIRASWIDDIHRPVVADRSPLACSKGVGSGSASNPGAPSWTANVPGPVVNRGELLEAWRPTDVGGHTPFASRGAALSPVNAATSVGRVGRAGLSGAGYNGSHVGPTPDRIGHDSTTRQGAILSGPGDTHGVGSVSASSVSPAFTHGGVPKSIMASSSTNETTVGGAHAYDHRAVPRSSALAGGTERRPLSSSFAKTEGTGGLAVPNGGVSTETMRQGCGFRNAAGPVSGERAGRKTRKVTIITD